MQRTEFEVKEMRDLLIDIKSHPRVRLASDTQQSIIGMIVALSWALRDTGGGQTQLYFNGSALDERDVEDALDQLISVIRSALNRGGLEISGRPLQIRPIGSG